MRYVILFGILAVVGMVIFIPTGLTIFLSRPDVVPPPQKPQTRPHTGEDILINVYMENTRQTVRLNLEEYLKGVVAAEMPAGFEIEALKAQAVAARTYAAKQMKAFGGKGHAGHPEADISSNYNDGQAFVAEEELKLKWGKDFAKYWNKISSAVNSTRGIILTHDGELINAVFHSTSGDRTAGAKEVWGLDYPYLKSVVCPWDKLSPKYNDVKEISAVELRAKLGGNPSLPAIASGASPADPINILSRTESGRVGEITIDGKILSGLEVREKLELRSTNFTIEPSGNNFLIKTSGYGHGVGLCQYGANGQAKEGRDFRQILSYYYQGAVIMNLFGS